MEIVLYYAPITCALAPYITLTEAGAKFEVRPLNFSKGQHNSPEYLKLNPKHKVPLLIVDGKVLGESTAIQPWIARTFPQAKLMPADPWQEFQAMSLIHGVPAAFIRSWRGSTRRRGSAMCLAPRTACESWRSAQFDGVVQDRR